MKARIFWILTAAAAFPLPSPASGLNIVFSMGAVYRPQPGYRYDFSRIVNPGSAFFPAEYGTGSDRLSRADIYAPEFGLGFVYKNFTLGLTAAPFSEMFTGRYALAIPRKYYYGQIAEASAEAQSKMSGVSFGVRLTFALPSAGAFRTYAGAGAHFLPATLELAADIESTDFFLRDPDTGLVKRGLEIMAIEFSPVSFFVWGFFILGGIEFRPIPEYGIFLEARYQTGKKDVAHPYYSQLDGSADPIRLEFSGFVLSFGVRAVLDP